MFRFLHAADIHLDSPLRGLTQYEGAPVERIRGATRRAFQRMIELALEERVAFVLLAGDLFDGDWKDYNTGLFFHRQVARLGEAGVPVFMVAGNHDAASQISRQLRLPDGVHRFSDVAAETVRLDDLGVAVHGRSYRQREVSEDLSASYPEPLPGMLNIGLLHTSLDGREGHANYAPCTVDSLRARGYDYWALGHVHAREVVSSEAPCIVFPGNLQGRHVRETGPKGCTLVSVEGGVITDLAHRSVDVLRWAQIGVDASGLPAAEAIIDACRAALQGAVDGAEGRPLAVRLTIEGATIAHTALATDAARWEAELRAVAGQLGDIWIEKLRLRTTSEGCRDAALDRDDALGGLLRDLRDLEFEGAEISWMGDALAALERKLPPDLRQGDEPFLPSDPTSLRAEIHEIRELLLTRLIQGAAGDGT